MKYLTTNEAAEYLKCTPLTLRGWYRKGKIKGYKPNNKNILFTEPDLDKFVMNTTLVRRIFK
jgi:excisionase family DNA binding protein